MESRSRTIDRTLQWAFVACSAVALWVAGYYGGRSSGREQGYVDGLVPTPAGIQMGRVDALQEIIDRASRKAPSEQSYDVRALIGQRLGKKSGEPTNREAIDAEIAKLVDEIYRDVAPERKVGGADSEFVLRRIPTEQTLSVKADGRTNAEVAIYLKSRDDYLAWKRTVETMTEPVEER